MVYRCYSEDLYNVRKFIFVVFIYISNRYHQQFAIIYQATHIQNKIDGTH